MTITITREKKIQTERPFRLARVCDREGWEILDDSLPTGAVFNGYELTFAGPASFGMGKSRTGLLMTHYNRNPGGYHDKGSE